jgi:adenosylcobinamide kinase/adenosylcobinamide-phosphate guanylyltransferase
MTGVKNGKIIFVLGGAKSGKSSFALAKAEIFPGRKAYIATAEPLDDEMRERIQSHRDQRKKDWDTIEEPLQIAHMIRAGSGKYSVLLIDCLTLWLTNLLCRNRNVEDAMDDFLDSLLFTSHSSLLFIVSNEVGMGIVPDNALARRFRDLAGRLNREVAAIADEVYLITAGIPIRMKP